MGKHSDYDKTKFNMDSYGNLIPKKPITGKTLKGITADESYGKDIGKDVTFEELSKELDL